MKKQFAQPQMFLQKCSYGNVDCLIDNPAEQVWKKAEIFSLND